MASHVPVHSDSHTEPFLSCGSFFFFLKLVYLVMLGLSCSMQDLIMVP